MSGNERGLGEFELISKYFARQGAAAQLAGGVILGIGDDAALLQMPPQTDLVAAVDSIVAGRHFPLDADPHSVGHRALAVNLSDLAAMGATPAWATLALTLPNADTVWLEGFSAGLLDLANHHGVALVGGDTTAGPLTISVQLLGNVPCGTALRRSGGKAGDLLAVTGTLGDAGAGLALATHRFATMNRQAADALIMRFSYPIPRVQFGRAARSLASAAIDLSDGLVGDLPKLAAASGLGAHVNVELLPLSAALQSIATPLEAETWALAAGDDYELLVAVAPERYAELAEVAQRLNIRLSVIGELHPGNAVTWTQHGDMYAPPGRGFDHFR